jgi:hypothetical protein
MRQDGSAEKSGLSFILPEVGGSETVKEQGQREERDQGHDEVAPAMDVE